MTVVNGQELRKVLILSLQAPQAVHQGRNDHIRFLRAPSIEIPAEQIRDSHQPLAFRKLNRFLYLNRLFYLCLEIYINPIIKNAKSSYPNYLIVSKEILKKKSWTIRSIVYIFTLLNL